MEERLERQAANEALFREVNERIATLNRSAGSAWAAEGELFDVLCECGREGGCGTAVRMTLAEYDVVRSQDDRFALAPGHETPELERIVERNDRFVVVDKVPVAEPYVEDDPRGAPSS